MSEFEIDRHGNKHWYNEKGDLHREDGPAVEYASGIKQWWLDNHLICFSQEEFERIINPKPKITEEESMASSTAYREKSVEDRLNDLEGAFKNIEKMAKRPSKEKFIFRFWHLLILNLGIIFIFSNIIGITWICQMSNSKWFPIAVTMTISLGVLSIISLIWSINILADNSDKLNQPYFLR